MPIFKEEMLALREKMDTQFDDLFLIRPKKAEHPLKEVLAPFAFEVESLLFELKKAVATDKHLYTPESALTPAQKKFLERPAQSMANNLNKGHDSTKDVMQTRLFTASPLFHLDFSYVPQPKEVVEPASVATVEQEGEQRRNQESIQEGTQEGTQESTQGSTEENVQEGTEEQAPSPLVMLEELLVKKTLAMPAQRLGLLLQTELTYAHASRVYDVPEVWIDRLTTGLIAYLQGHVSSAFTQLEAMSNERPNDALSAYVCAHVYYHHVAGGYMQSLPKARQYAKKATSSIQTLPTDVLYRLRYWCTVLDAGLKPERLLETVRNYELLKPFADLKTKTREEIALFIKVLALFADTDPNDWNDVDASMLGSVLNKILAGGFLYRALFFDKVMPYLVQDKSTKAHVFEGLKHVHEGVSAVFMGLEDIAEHVNLEDTAEGKQQEFTHIPWTVSQKFMYACEANLTHPQADAVLLNISLDGHEYTQTKLLDEALARKGVLLGAYWKFWIHQLLPMEGVYMPYNLPYKVVHTEKPLLIEFTQLLQLLKKEEETLVNNERWPLLSPYFATYKYADVVGTGARQAYRPSIFMPEEPSLKNCYLAWGGEGQAHMFLSELVEERAKRGGFSSLREVRALFEGIIKIFYDEDYGFAAKQNAAWRRYLEHQKGGILATAKKAEKQTPLWVKVLAETWWFFFLIFPSGVLAFLAVLTAPHLVLTTRVILLVLIGLGFLVAAFYAMHQARDVKKRMPKLKTVVDKAGNIHMGT